MPAVIAEEMGKWQGNNLFNLKMLSGRARQRVVEKQLASALKDKVFADLKIPLVVMAVDMLSGREVALRSGALIPAVLASSAIPAVFPPIEIEGMKLADGGVIDSLATHAAFAHGADQVIAVDIYPALEQDGWSDPLSAIMGFELPLLNNSSSNKSPGMVSAMWRSIRIITYHLHTERLATHPPHVLLRPDVASLGSLDFKDLKAPLNAGRMETERHLEAIKALAGAQV